MPSYSFSPWQAGCAMILFGIAVLLSIHMVTSRRDDARDDSLQWALNVAGWVLIVIGALGILVMLMSVLGAITGAIAFVVLVEVFVKHRVAQQYALLWVLATAAERSIPLSPAILAFGRERGVGFAQRARRLARLLDAGSPLPEALKAEPGVVPVEAMPLIHLGYEAGALAPALRRAATTPDSRRLLWLSLGGRVIYFLSFMLVGTAVVTFVMLKIVPSFQKIFQDFDAELPLLTRCLIETARWGADFGIVFAVVLLAISVLFLYTICCYLGWSRWSLPGTNWLFRRFDSAAILDALSLGAQYGRPLPESILSLARSYPNWSMRRRLWKALRDVNGGADWLESLYRRGVIQRADWTILRAAQRVGNLPWALREMADSARRRATYRMQALVQLMFPPVILILGGLVMFIVVGLFVPLVTLILKVVP